MRKIGTILLVLLFSIVSINGIELNLEEEYQEYAPLLDDKTNYLFSESNEIYNYQLIENDLFIEDRKINIDTYNTDIVFNDKESKNFSYNNQKNKQINNYNKINIVLSIILLVLLTYFLTIKWYKYANKNRNTRKQ